MRRRIPMLVLLNLVLISSLARLICIAFSAFDKNHSTAGFRLPNIGGFPEVEGKFTEFGVTIKYDPDSRRR